MTGRAWIEKAAPERTALMLAQRLDVPEIVGRVLAARGVTIEEAAHFLAPTLRALLPDPSTLIDMDVAAERLARAVRAGETVGVFGDYDVDGACAAALLTLLLRGLGCPVRTHVPDRLREGYGPNAPALAALIAGGATLLVCVDCGTAADAVLRPLAARADILVLDHHKAEGPPPAVLATVNPNRLDCRSGLPHLCAAAVAFLAAVATVRVLRRAGHFATVAEPALMGLLDMVALATVCDVMPLTGLNRAFVARGLETMAAGARPGLAALLEVAKARGGALSAATCGFALGPRINAGGRIAEADLGLRLLLCTDPLEARALAERLDAANRQRQSVEAAVLAQAVAQAEAQMAAGHAVLLVHGAGWHPGVVGIVAGRLRERFNRPACVGGGTDLVRGSGRSVPGLDLGAAVIAARQAGLLESGGGHAMAAGYAVPVAKLPALHEFLCERLAGALARPTTVPLAIEGVLSAGGATLAAARAIGRMAPFGTGNEEPVLAVRGVRVARADRIGRDGLTVRAMVEGDGRLKCLAFRAADNALGAALLERGGMLHLAGHVRAESWNGVESVSFGVVDAALA